MLLFACNQTPLISAGLEACLGPLTVDWDRFMPWGTVRGDIAAGPEIPQLEVLLEAVFDKRRFPGSSATSSSSRTTAAGRLLKEVASCHQFYAVRVAVAETLRAANLARAVRVAEATGRYEAKRKPGGDPDDRRIGVIWHTQGSGKSLTMVFYAGRIIREPVMENPTIVVLTDCNDLDDQLFDTFSRCQDLLRQPPLQAESRAHLRKLLSVEAGGVAFTTTQEFFPDEKGDRHPTLSQHCNIVVIADEAHRSQYDSSMASPATCAMRCPMPRSSASRRRGQGNGPDLLRRLARQARPPGRAEAKGRRGVRKGHRGRGGRAQREAQDRVGAAG